MKLSKDGLQKLGKLGLWVGVVTVCSRVSCFFFLFCFLFWLSRVKDTRRSTLLTNQIRVWMRYQLPIPHSYMELL